MAGFSMCKVMQAKPKILVIGSSNMDLVIQADHFPRPGETLIGGNFSMISGGKGANQAVAAARLGGDVVFLAQVGNDPFGQVNLESYEREGIDTSLIERNPDLPSGVALITVSESGENTIIVAPGANAGMDVDNLKKAADKFAWADVVLLQLEIPLEVVTEAARMAKAQGKKVILNPAPARALPAELLENVDIITPNETEAEFLTGISVSDISSAALAAARINASGIQKVIITLGENGAFLADGNTEEIIPTKRVKAVDTTAAGDTLNGALAVSLGRGESINMAVSFALKAATLSVQRLGAQSSIPYLSEL
ncbi:ribokinase [Mariniradius sediminis]|uniref:Ribokinase n=1 Tax=Mariniradius sediminis TaxID=2909237 RepID=A0ABS9BYI3_9BACT|nr:ribokinase [Mariniradius sediminis]MCF1753118.1 ribokinase [Mariniradius sediminis]